MAGSKGPAVMLIRGNAQYRNAYIIALARRDWFGAIDAICGMASILPKEANYKLPEPPQVLFTSQHIDIPKEIEIKKWVLTERVRVEQAISQYVYKFYKSGGSTL